MKTLVQKKNGKLVWTTDLESAIKKKINSGTKISCIAAEMEVHPSTIRRRMQKIGFDYGNQEPEFKPNYEIYSPRCDNSVTIRKGALDFLKKPSKIGAQFVYPNQHTFYGLEV